ncbi:MAG: hypothetical protein J5881_04775, partial [Clostridia bacterium]|nr:hypothetical protein [Clostridia bacterium]
MELITIIIKNILIPINDFQFLSFFSAKLLNTCAHNNPFTRTNKKSVEVNVLFPEAYIVGEKLITNDAHILAQYIIA